VPSIPPASADSEHPILKMLHPDFNLKLFESVQHCRVRSSEAETDNRVLETKRRNDYWQVSKTFLIFCTFNRAYCCSRALEGEEPG
jgi:hypothetical protein